MEKNRQNEKKKHFFEFFSVIFSKLEFSTMKKIRQIDYGSKLTNLSAINPTSGGAKKIVNGNDNCYVTISLMKNSLLPDFRGNRATS